MPSDDAERVVRELGLRTVLVANWQAGLAAAQSEGVFVTPPVSGFVLAVGPDLHGNGDYARIVPRLLERLSASFGAAAWFLTHDEAQHHGWGLARDGRVVRAYAHTDDGGDVLSEGEVTPAERALGCFVDDPRDRSDDAIKWWPDEAIVLRMAGGWAVDPSRISALGLPVSSGWLGRL